MFFVIYKIKSTLEVFNFKRILVKAIFYSAYRLFILTDSKSEVGSRSSEVGSRRLESFHTDTISIKSDIDNIL